MSAGREYTYRDGERWPSVTEILALAGLSDLSGIAPDVLENARMRGTEVHAWTELVDRGTPDSEIEPDEEVAPYVDAWRLFLADTGFKPELIEEALHSDTYRYVGKLDRLGTMRRSKDLWLIDIKATAAIAPQTGVQLAGYELLFDEDPRIVGLVRRAVVQLKPDGRYKMQKFDDTTDVDDFLACLRVAKWRLRYGLASLED